MAEVVRNRVFRCIENRARGFIGLLLVELLAGFVVFSILMFSGHPLLGLLSGAGALASLVGWRKKDQDRSDYLANFWRRQRREERIYSPLGD